MQGACDFRPGGVSANFVVRLQKEENPFAPFNRFPKAGHLPNTQQKGFAESRRRRRSRRHWRSSS